MAGKGREIGYLNVGYMSTSLGTWGGRLKSWLSVYGTALFLPPFLDLSSPFLD